MTFNFNKDLAVYGVQNKYSDKIVFAGTKEDCDEWIEELRDNSKSDKL